MDWNNDGKKDLILGEEDGHIRIYLNTHTDADPTFSGFTYVQRSGSNFDVGSDASPYIIDWNNDGKKDLLVGDGGGFVFLLLNTNTDADPVFTGSVKIQDGGAALRVPGNNSCPVVADWNNDGKKDLLVGDAGGDILYFVNKGPDIAPVFDGSKLLSAEGAKFSVPGCARFEAWDWNNDGIKDLLCGFYGGVNPHAGVYYFQGELNYFPDLAVDSYSGPAQADPGEMVGSQLSLDITNQGNCVTSGFHIGLYLSKDPEITIDDQVLTYGIIEIVEELDVGDVYTVPIVVYIKIPSGIAPGLYYLGPLLDMNEIIGELNEGNNSTSQPILIGDLSLGADVDTLPEAGGTANFFLCAGANNGDRNYLLVAGTSGTTPGMPLPGGLVTLPVNWDWFSDLEMALLNTVVFSNFMGKLDGEGSMSAQLYLPALPAGTAGIKMYFAYCLNKPFDFVSNHVRVEIVP